MDQRKEFVAMVKKIVVLGFVSGFALYLYGRKALGRAQGAKPPRIAEDTL
jgi:hypothetical protein